MAPEVMPEDEVRRIVQEETDLLVAELEEAIRQYRRDEIISKAINLAKEILPELEERGFDSSRADVQRAAIRTVVDAIQGNLSSVKIEDGPDGRPRVNEDPLEDHRILTGQMTVGERLESREDEESQPNPDDVSPTGDPHYLR